MRLVNYYCIVHSVFSVLIVTYLKWKQPSSLESVEDEDAIRKKNVEGQQRLRTYENFKDPATTSLFDDICADM